MEPFEIESAIQKDIEITHIEVQNPREDIRRLLCAMTPRGLFYARTPYHVATAKLLRSFGYHFDMGFPAHLHDMGSTFWNDILDTMELSDQFHVEVAGIG